MTQISTAELDKIEAAVQKFSRFLPPAEYVVADLELRKLLTPDVVAGLVAVAREAPRAGNEGIW